MTKRLTIEEKIKSKRLKVVEKEGKKLESSIKSLKGLIKDVKGKAQKTTITRLKMNLDTKKKLLKHLKSKK